MPFSLNTPCSLFLVLQLPTIVPQLTDLFLSGLYSIFHLCISFWIVLIPISSGSLTFFGCNVSCFLLHLLDFSFWILYLSSLCVLGLFYMYHFCLAHGFANLLIIWNILIMTILMSLQLNLSFVIYWDLFLFITFLKFMDHIFLIL